MRRDDPRYIEDLDVRMDAVEFESNLRLRREREAFRGALLIALRDPEVKKRVLEIVREDKHEETKTP